MTFRLADSTIVILNTYSFCKIFVTRRIYVDIGVILFRKRKTFIGFRWLVSPGYAGFLPPKSLFCMAIWSFHFLGIAATLPQGRSVCSCSSKHSVKSQSFSKRVSLSLKMWILWAMLLIRFEASLDRSIVSTRFSGVRVATRGY